MSELAREARKKVVRRRRKLREGLVRMARTVRKRAAVVVWRLGLAGWGGGERRGSLSSSDGVGLWCVDDEDDGREEMTGIARRRRRMPTQRGSQSKVVMVAEASAGPSWREKIEEMALT